jgi:hypothetical protein
MKRFFFNVCGSCNIRDELGIRFESELGAFREAQRLAQDLSEVRPLLGGKAWISLTQEGSWEMYCIGIPAAGARRVEAIPTHDHPRSQAREGRHRSRRHRRRHRRIAASG